MNDPRLADDDILVEPSWMTALSEAAAASRRLAQAATSVERLSKELAALREWSDEKARLDLARALTEGPDGGTLSLLVAAAAARDADPGFRRAAAGLLDRLASSLGLQPIVERGEYLRLLPEERGEFAIRGRAGSPAADGRRELFRVMRPGWWLGNHIVERPLLEPVAEETSHLAASNAAQGA